ESVEVAISESSPVVKEESNSSEGQSEPAQTVVTAESSESSEKKPEVSSQPAPKPRRPVYQEGENVVLDLKDLKGAFGAGAGGAGSISDMMKAFAPMMEGLMGGLSTMNMS